MLGTEHAHTKEMIHEIFNITIDVINKSLFILELELKCPICVMFVTWLDKYKFYLMSYYNRTQSAIY